MSVPGDSARREFRMRTAIFFSIAGSTVAGCSTFAPKYASSAASAKEQTCTRWPPGKIGEVGGEHAVHVGPDLDLYRLRCPRRRWTPCSRSRRDRAST